MTKHSILIALFALVAFCIPLHSADNEPTVAELKARVKELEGKIASMEDKLRAVGIGEATEEELAKFQKYVDSLPVALRHSWQHDLEMMSPSERLQIIHRIAGMSPQVLDRARRMEEAKRVREDLTLIDSALDQYTLETEKKTGFHPTFEDIKKYLKSTTTLYATGADVFGRAYGPFTVDSLPQVPEETFNALSDVTTPDFWKPFHGE